MKSRDHYDVVVIGGGASGMMTALCAAEDGKSVIILEKNRNLGQKLDITGGGRCNITNAEFDTRKLLSVYGDAAPFLYSPFSQFSVQNTFDFFERFGLPLVVQARGRAFPHTEKSTDVCNLFKRELKKLGVTVQTNCSVKKIIHDQGTITGVLTDSGTVTGNSYILATGGMSHPETGSTGDGFTFLKSLGHTVKDPTPSIVPLQVADSWVHELAGVSLSFMKITFYTDAGNGPKKQFSKTGKVLFTHFGLSGPLILNSATNVADLLYIGKVTAAIDTAPDTNEGVFEQQIVKIFDAHKNKILRTAFKEMAPKGTAKVLETMLPQLDFMKKVHSITREERKMIVKLLKALPITITNLMGYDRAVVADGGVYLAEVDTKTMRSKKYNNLFVTGDLLNINRPSGGYGLQLCWTTGYVAGKNA